MSDEHPLEMDARKGNWLNWEASLCQLIGSFVRCYTADGSIYCGIVSSVDTSLTAVYLNYAYIESSKQYISQWPEKKTVEILLKTLVMLVTDRGVPAPEHYPLIEDQPDQQVNEIEPEPELSEQVDKNCGFVVEISSNGAIQNTDDSTPSLQLRPGKKSASDPRVALVPCSANNPTKESQSSRLWKPRSLHPVVQKLNDESQSKRSERTLSRSSSPNRSAASTQQTVRGAVKKSEKAPVKNAPKESAKEPVKKPTKWPIKQAVTQQVQEEPQPGPQAVMQPMLYSSVPYHSVPKAPPLYQPTQQPFLTQFLTQPPSQPMLAQLQQPIQQTVQIIPVQQQGSPMTILHPMAAPQPVQPPVVSPPPQPVVIPRSHPMTALHPKTPQSTQQVPAPRPAPPPAQMIPQSFQPALSHPSNQVVIPQPSPQQTHTS
ncbi:hypothetical protein WA171_002940 [Blastocystis sp. BT1]